MEPKRVHFQKLSGHWVGKSITIAAPRTWYGKGPDYGDSLEFILWDQVFGFLGLETYWLPLEMLSKDSKEFHDALLSAGSKSDLTILWPTPLSSWDFETLARLRGQTRLALMNSADPVQFQQVACGWLPYVDYCLTTDPATLPLYEAEKFSSVFLTQWAANPFRYREGIHPRSYCWCFPGQIYGIRGMLLEYLHHNLPGGARVSQTPGDGFIRLMQASHIVMNFSGASGQTGGRQIKSRVFEPQLLGTVLCTEYAQGLEDYWDLQEEILCWYDVEECVEQTRQILRDEAKRRRLVQAAQRRAAEEHTWVHRFHDFFRAIWS